MSVTPSWHFLWLQRRPIWRTQFCFLQDVFLRNCQVFLWFRKSHFSVSVNCISQILAWILNILQWSHSAVSMTSAKTYLGHTVLYNLDKYIWQNICPFGEKILTLLALPMTWATRPIWRTQFCPRLSQQLSSLWLDNWFSNPCLWNRSRDHVLTLMFCTDDI